MEIDRNDARAIAGFIVRYLKLCNEDAPFEDFDHWRAEVRNRFPEQTDKVLLKVQEGIMEFQWLGTGKLNHVISNPSLVMRKRWQKILKIEEKIPEHVFNYIEKELYAYRIYQTALGELESDLEDLAEQYPQSRTDFFSTRKEPGDPVGLAATRSIIIEEKIKRNLNRIRKIEAGLKVLRPEEKQLVETKYFSDEYYTNDQIMIQLQMSRNSFYRIRNEIVYKFAMIFNVL